MEVREDLEVGLGGEPAAPTAMVALVMVTEISRPKRCLRSRGPTSMGAQETARRERRARPPWLGRASAAESSEGPPSSQ